MFNGVSPVDSDGSLDLYLSILCDGFICILWGPKVNVTIITAFALAAAFAATTAAQCHRGTHS